MRIKRFEQLNESITKDTIKKIYDEYMSIVNADEEDEEFSYESSEFAEFAHDIYKKYDLTLTDVQEIIDTYPHEWYITTYFGDIIDQDRRDKEAESVEYKFITDTLSKHNVDPTEEAVDAVREILSKYRREW